MEILFLIILLYIAVISTYQLIYRGTFTSRSRQQPLFVDTSVLIDGRILAVAQSGFLTSPLYIPRSVIGELQLLADGSDSDRRSRARYGLDVVKELQAMEAITVEIFKDNRAVPEGVDNRLLWLAKKYHATICTIDYNLIKVAEVEKIAVANVNDLAMGLRMAYLPGEKILLEITQKGNDGHQGVGHLKDGTMVVVENASQSIGKTVEVEFIRSLQTAAGKMMFAKVVKAPISPTPANKTGQVATPKAPSHDRSKRQHQSNSPQEHRPANRRPQGHKKPLTNEERLIALANGTDGQ